MNDDLEYCLDGLSPLERLESLRIFNNTINKTPPNNELIPEWIDLRCEIRRRINKIERLFILDEN